MMKMSLFISLMSILLLACSGRNIIQQEHHYVKQEIEGHPELLHQQLTLDGHRLHYVVNHHKQALEVNKPTLIIIHGTPGSWRQYARYLLNEALLDRYTMIVIDRPGWGSSVLADDLLYADFELQAKIIAALAQRYKQLSGGQAVVLMGHSLGASIAPRVAMDFPNVIDGLLLFAGTVDPSLSSPRWFNYLGRLPLMHYLIGEELYRSNEEIFALSDNIDAMKDRWQEITVPVISVQGMKDGLVYPANSFYIEREFNSTNTTVIRLENEGHLFPMTQRKEVVSWAELVLEKIHSTP